MARWVNCTIMDGTDIQVNMDHVVLIRPHHHDRGFTGSEIVFVSGAPQSIHVKQTGDELAGPPGIERVRVNV